MFKREHFISKFLFNVFTIYVHHIIPDHQCIEDQSNFLFSKLHVFCLSEKKMRESNKEKHEHKIKWDKFTHTHTEREREREREE